MNYFLFFPGLSDSAPEDQAEGRAGHAAQHGSTQPRLIRPQPQDCSLQPAVRPHRHLRPQDRGPTAGDFR